MDIQHLALQKNSNSPWRGNAPVAFQRTCLLNYWMSYPCCEYLWLQYFVSYKISCFVLGLIVKPTFAKSIDFSLLFNIIIQFFDPYSPQVTEIFLLKLEVAFLDHKNVQLSIPALIYAHILKAKYSTQFYFFMPSVYRVYSLKFLLQNFFNINFEYEERTFFWENKI